MGILTNIRPISVILYVFSFKQPKYFIIFRDSSSPSMEGFDRYGKVVTFSIPSDFSLKTRVSKAIFWIYGVFPSWKLFLCFSEYSRKQKPSFVLPALPALCFAEDLLIPFNFNEDIFVFWSKTISLSSPGSTTTLTPSIVMEVSAILVAKISLYYFEWEKTSLCSYGASLPWRGNTLKTRGFNFRE